MTGIEKIKYWRKCFGLPNREIPQVTNLDEANLSFKLIKEELVEYHKALYPNGIHDEDEKEYFYKPNLVEIADSLGDLLFVVVQGCMIHGLDPEMLIDRVYTSNISKGTFSEQEAKESVETYKQKGIDTYYIETNGFYILKRNSDNKVLKMNSFVEPDWEFLK